jgi:hypothetical protein
MPVEVKAWGCSHGCKRGPSASFKAVERHEESCAMNPSTRSCKTCASNRLARSYQGSPTKYICSIGQLLPGKKIMFGCKFYSQEPSLDQKG